MTPIPPAMMSGPPPAPAGSPTLSAFPTSGPESSPGPGQVGAIPRLFFVVDRTLDIIAKAVPGSSEQITAIKGQLQEVLAKALQGGAMGNPAGNGGPY